MLNSQAGICELRMIIGGAAAVEQADRHARPWLRFEVQLANELGHARSEVVGKDPRLRRR